MRPKTLIYALCALTGVLIVGCIGEFKGSKPLLSEDVQPPVLLEQVAPVYPDQAQAEGLEGDVHLYLLVSDSGNVKHTKISKSSGYKLLDDAAIDYAKKLKFEPARKNGEPINIWLTWDVSYKLTPAETFCLDYVQKIERLFQLAERVHGEEKEPVLQKILDTHDRFINGLDESSGLNYNRYFQRFIAPQVYQRWKDLWQYLPLQFVVFDDFIFRYPESEKVSYAITRLIALIKDDIGRIKELDKSRPGFGKKKDQFLKIIYNFLNDNYPQAITDDMKQEAEMYLKLE